VAAASLWGAGRQGGFEGGADLGAAGVPTPLLLRLVEHAGLLCPSLLFGRGWSMRAPPPSLPRSSAPLPLSLSDEIHGGAARRARSHARRRRLGARKWSRRPGIADEDASVALDDKSGTKMTRSRKLEDENG